MQRLQLKNRAPDADGLVHRVTPETAGWSHVGFELHRLRPGQALARETGEREACLVIVAGRAEVAAGGERWAGLGGRASPFAGDPCSVYVPWRARWRVVAVTDLELAVCTAPGGGAFPARLIPPEAVGRSSRGTGSNLRHVRDILPDSAPWAHSLLVVEVVTPAGHWSSYPPHKHDVADPPREARLEETYYHRLEPPRGFAFQRVYSDDRSLDVVLAVEDGDVVLVPRGYHPCAAPPGYDLWYLNAMAGPERAWRFTTEPQHRWLLG